MLAAAIAASTGIVAFAPSSATRPSAVVPAAEAKAPSTPPSTPSPSPSPPRSPFEQAEQALDQQAAALLDGDEARWLAAVDPRKPELVARYRSMFRSLRGLGVSQFDYQPHIRPGGKGATVAVGTTVNFCFSLSTCPEGAGAPAVEQSLTVSPVGGRYVITALTKTAEPTQLQPAPWESGDLVFARGRRVTVAGPKSQSRNLRRVLAVAEKSAKINDRFAGYVRNPQTRYRVLLADEKTWKSWYGGIEGSWTVAYAVPLNSAGTDVVLRMSKLSSDAELLATTVQHELGHVVTLSGLGTRDFDEDQWLTEGIAEYIGWSPRHAAASWRRGSVRTAFRGDKRPRTIASKPLSDDASDSASDRFYGLGHFAADCMAQRYGEPALFEFVRLVLRADNTYDQASRAAFGKPFTAVDKACLTWIRRSAS
ncbi:hypothetical protein AB0M20_06810 [Actinoplanes sp. NPDC051633]|uniref:hypothetical protein n=1 Tax=Actinoplanes sp. NPDC051633 TaxID=3155670 RepID=UPI0034452366